MDKFVAFLAISELQYGCTTRTLIKTQQCQQTLTNGKVATKIFKEWGQSHKEGLNLKGVTCSKRGAVFKGGLT